ncbi:MAG: carbohydrate kinase family protein, partial [Mogibacterium sp.]|nr:carbohydrate kinase family protein [Mogibacterium sp.]
TAENPTPVTTIFVAEDGNRKSITNNAHSYNFHPEKYPDVFTDTKAVVIGSLFRAPFNDPDVIKSVVSEAHAKGIPVFADTKIPNFRKLTLDDIADSLPMIDYITPNEDEARFFTGETEPAKMAEVFLSKGVKNVIIKLGARGCLFRNSTKSIFLPAHKIRVVDATGAGDNFMAGFVSELIRGSDVRDALVVANAGGAICATAVGTGTALCDREQVLRMLSSNN